LRNIWAVTLLLLLPSGCKSEAENALEVAASLPSSVGHEYRLFKIHLEGLREDEALENLEVARQKIYKFDKDFNNPRMCVDYARGARLNCKNTSDEGYYDFYRAYLTLYSMEGEWANRTKVIEDAVKTLLPPTE